MNVVASSPEGLEKSLAEEISNLGGFNINTYKRFINFECDFETFYRVHFYSRLAFRFYREIASFNCYDKQSLYAGVRDSFDWLNWLHFDKTFNVQVTGRTSSLSHTHFTALEVKNSITDLQQAVWNKRSNISLDNPDFIIHLHLNNNKAILSLQSSVESLHKRGYRPAIGNAPLKENLASGLINMTQWNGKVPLIDFMCGSGTFLIEAAMQIFNIPAGYVRENYAFFNFQNFDKKLWETIKKEGDNAINYKEIILNGSDVIDKNIDLCIESSKKLGLEKYISFKRSDFRNIKPKETSGTVLINPPYGHRIGEVDKLRSMYKDFGDHIKNNFSGFDGYIFTGNLELLKHVGLRTKQKIILKNGKIDCRLAYYPLRSGKY